LERTDRGLTAGAGALDEDVDLLHAVLLGTASGGLGGELRREGRRLARALEADLARRGPRDDGTRGVRDRHDRVVEGALDVRVAVRDVLLLLATGLPCAGASLGRHFLVLLSVRGPRVARAARPGADYLRPAFFLPATVRLGPLRVRALVLVR